LASFCGFPLATACPIIDGKKWSDRKGIRNKNNKKKKERERKW